MSYNGGRYRNENQSPNYRRNQYGRRHGEDMRRRSGGRNYYHNPPPRHQQQFRGNTFHSPQRPNRRHHHHHDDRRRYEYPQRRYNYHPQPQPQPPPHRYVPPNNRRRQDRERSSRSIRSNNDTFQPDEEVIRHGKKRKRRPSPPNNSSTSSRPKKKRKIMEYTPKELEIRNFHYGSTLSVIDRQKFEKEFDSMTLNLSLANRREFVRSPRKFLQKDRCLSILTSPREKYKRRQGEAKTVDHWGQRKLLMSEIEFLTLYSDKDYNLVVYAGAAPGTHTNFLAELFPELKFVLVDPADFKARETDRIKIIQDFFTDEMAKEYSKEKTIFISDIRSMTKEMSEEDKTRCVLRDMGMQRKWMNIMKPKAALFKLRFPYTKGKTSYLKGQIFAPCWGPRTTTETRLVVTNENQIWPAEEMVYDHTDYEEMMFYFNTVTRTTFYPHDFGYDSSEGFCHCFDCNSEIRILKNYIQKVKKIPEFMSSKPISYGDEEEGEEEEDKEENIQMKEEVIKMSKLISRKITMTGKRTLHIDSALNFRYWGFSNYMEAKGREKRKKRSKMFKKRLKEGKDFDQIGRDEDDDDEED